MPNDEPAFPIGANLNIIHNGLTKREWFAGMALQGLLSGRGHESVEDLTQWQRVIANTCFDYADAMLKESSNDRPKP